MFLFWKQHASLTLTDGVATSEFFALIWHSHHLRSLSRGVVWEGALVTRYQPLPMPVSFGSDRTLKKHLSSFRTHVSWLFWRTWFIICLCSGWGFSILGFRGQFDPISSAPVDWKLFSLNTASLLHLWNRLNSEDSYSVLCFNQQYLASSHRFLVCISQKRSFTSWLGKRLVPRWSAMAAPSSLEALLSAKVGCYQADKGLFCIICLCKQYKLLLGLLLFQVIKVD